MTLKAIKSASPRILIPVVVALVATAIGTFAARPPAGSGAERNPLVRNIRSLIADFQAELGEFDAKTMEAADETGELARRIELEDVKLRLEAEIQERQLEAVETSGDPRSAEAFRAVSEPTTRAYDDWRARHRLGNEDEDRNREVSR